MGQENTPFLQKDYTYNDERKTYDVLLEVKVGTKESLKKVTAIVDTGCSSGIHLCKSFVNTEKLVFIKKININPVPVHVADGHTINADIYKAICQMNGKEEEIIVSVIDPEKFFEEGEGTIVNVRPLLGRDLLDKYDVLFKGKERKLAISCSELNNRESSL
jgi:predicted aspartyl protease